MGRIVRYPYAPARTRTPDKLGKMGRQVSDTASGIPAGWQGTPENAIGIPVDMLGI